MAVSNKNNAGFSKRRINLLKDRWVWRIVWKDARQNKGRLLLFLSTVVVGIATLVAVSSFNNNLRSDIDAQAKALLGADLVLYSDKDIQEPLNMLDSLPYELASDARLSTMVAFPQREGGRLAQLVALEGNYPFYGGMETLPAHADSAFRAGVGILVDEGLALEYALQPGDSVKVGKLVLPLAGVVTKLPGSIKVIGTLAPSVYIPFQQLKETGLIKKGSRIAYRIYLKAGEEQTPEALLEELKPKVNRWGMGYETVAFRKESLGHSFENLYRFLNLLGYIALVLGSIGVGSSVHVYTREKYGIVAILRCLGVPGRAPFLIFFIQITLLGVLGSLVGVAFGSLVQFFIPLALSDFLPMPLDFQVSWPAVAEGMLVGLVITVLFSLIPLLQIRYVPPMAVLRANFKPCNRSYFLKALVALAIVLFNWGLAIRQLEDVRLGSLFFSSFLLTLIAFLLTASVIKWILRVSPLKNLGFVYRQSLANLFRANNQTLVLMTVIGFGTFLTSTVSIVETGILDQVVRIGNKTRANLVLFDVQPDQREQAEKLIADYGAECQELMPILMVRLGKINGKSLDEVQKDSLHHIPNWLLYMEHLATYRDHLLETETLIDGQLRSVEQKGDSVFISVTEMMAEQLGLGLNDQLVFNLHGISVTAYVGSIRKSDWQQVQTNFAFVFPTGVLEKAPQFYAMLLYTQSKWQTASLKQAVIEEMPNVSAIDLSLILRTIDDVVGRLSFAIRFMAMFSIMTGLLVLIGSVLNSKYTKIRENTLLRTLGALQRQIVRISLLEYGYLGGVAALLGLSLSFLATWGLSAYFLDLVFTPNYWRMLEIFLFIVGLTIGLSWLNLHSILQRSPLEVLRKGS